LDLFQAIGSFISAHAKLIMDIGKIVLALIMLLFSLFSLWIVINFTILLRKLQEMESSAVLLREEIITLFTEARTGIRGLQDSLVGESSNFNTSELLRSGGRIAMLLLSGERNLVAWGMLGFKVAGKALRYFLSRR
jgi:hypothetical protein